MSYIQLFKLTINLIDPIVKSQIKLSMISNRISQKLSFWLKQSQILAAFSKAKPAHTKGNSPKNIIDLPMGQVFDQMTEKYPSNIFINSYSQNVSFTYEKAHQMALSLATGMIKNLGLKPKDRIGIYSYNKWEWVIIQMAAAMADLILVNINPAYQSEELAYTLEKVGLKVLFLSDSFKKSNYLNIIKKIVPELQMGASEWEIRSNRFHFLKAVVRFNEAEQTEQGFINFSDLFVQGDRKCLPKWPSCHDATNIQFTSGTTGLPKAATLSHYNILNNGYQIGNRLNYTDKDNITLPVPFYHCFGMVMGNLAALTRGAGITIVGQGFDPQKSLQAAEKYKSTSIYGVPTMFIEYLRVLEEDHHKNYDLSNLKRGIVAGSLCSQPLMNKIIGKLGLVDITNCYGMTETAPVSFQTSPSDSIVKKTTTVGRILDGMEAKIVDENGQTVNVGEAGEFWTKGWHVMIEYWSDKKATQRSIENGWMKSGDMAVLDEEGYMSIVGRKKDMIIRGGENVYPKEIQDYLFKMDGVQDAQVVGVVDEKFGQQIAAVIKVKNLEHNKITGRQILNHCKGNIAHYKIPKYVKFVTEYPLTVSGKVQKFIMKQQFEEEMKAGKHTQYIIR